jgi:predicted  nucleic acid-binding Zn-ribbon protein
MPLTAESLQKLHRLHQQVTNLRERLEKGPRQLLAKEKELAGVEQLQVDLKEQITRVQMAADEKQLESRERDAKVADLKGKLISCSTNKEYQTLTEEIEVNRVATSDIDDEVLAFLEELDKLEQQAEELGGRQSEVSSQLGQLKGDVEADQKQLGEELERTQGELKEAENQLPDDFRQDYQLLAESRGEGALAEVDSEVCSGCYQRITSQMLNELFLSKPVFCKSCGCLLYLAEGESISGESNS